MRAAFWIGILAFVSLFGIVSCGGSGGASAMVALDWDGDLDLAVANSTGGKNVGKLIIGFQPWWHAFPSGSH